MQSIVIAPVAVSITAFGILSTTGGGIKRSITYPHVARIRARKTNGCPDHQHFELLFDDNLDLKGAKSACRVKCEHTRKPSASSCYIAEQLDEHSPQCRRMCLSFVHLKVGCPELLGS